jgi:hypothetical protein
MKEIYSFPVSRKIEKTVPYIKKNKSGESIESTKKVVENEEIRMIFAKPSMLQIEEAEFFYGQKFNEYINAGFLTKAMLSKKMGDIGGFSSKTTLDVVNKNILENIEAAKVIEFYGGAKNLSSEQQEKLELAKVAYAETQRELVEYEQNLRSQFSQTADAKAEQKIIEWFLFNCCYYEETLEGKKETFPLFVGDSFDNKRRFYLELCQSADEISDIGMVKIKNIFDLSFDTLVRAVSIWYNKMGENQESIEKLMKDLFVKPDETKTEENVKKEVEQEEPTEE